MIIRQNFITGKGFRNDMGRLLSLAWLVIVGDRLISNEDTCAYQETKANGRRLLRSQRTLPLNDNNEGSRLVRAEIALATTNKIVQISSGEDRPHNDDKEGSRLP
jgi:hypothetical protein